MAFKIEKSTQNGLKTTILKNVENQTQVQILPDYGALWHGWILQKNKKPVNLIDHYADKEDLKTNLRISHKSANLTPFACRIADGKYTFQGRDYEFPNKSSDGSAIHGLLVDKPFQQIDSKITDEGAQITFLYNYRGEDPGYPFEYDCEVTYTLHRDNSLTLSTKIKNKTDGDIPLMDGWHPYFKTGSRIDDCRLQFNVTALIDFNEKLVPTGEFTDYNEFNQPRHINNTKLDNAFLIDKKAAQPICTFEDPETNVKIAVKASQNYPVLQLYTPTERKSLAIETLSSAPDAFNNRIALVLLDPGETKTFSTTYAAQV